MYYDIYNGFRVNKISKQLTVAIWVLIMLTALLEIYLVLYQPALLLGS